MSALVQIAVICLFWGAVLGVLLLVGRRYLIQSQIRRRMVEVAAGGGGIAGGVDPAEQDILTRWLFLAGFRAPGAAFAFLSITFLALTVGVAVALMLTFSGVVARSAWLLSPIPGAVSDLFAVVVYSGPWVFLLILVLIPTLIVRNSRQRRVTEVEQDLPLLLELLATLSEAGLGFDAALERVLQGQPPDRVLSSELRTFQLEALAGRPRVQCFRRLARRVEVTALSVFVSALVQAEQVGAGVADVLRRQAEDARDRRREQAIALASSLPVKLTFPLVLCFLPAIFVVTLGPIAAQYISTAGDLLPKNQPTLRTQPLR
jgi:tight adherence protein C